MGKSENKEIMGLVYREFSRQKYNKYKHQFPKMRESEIVNKIIREWDTLDPTAKRRLKSVYCQNRSLRNDEHSDSETAKKSDAARATEQGSGKKDESEANIGLPLEPDSTRKEREELRPEGREEAARHKSAGKVMGTDYITFFKHYYEKYSREHPKWSASQVSKIITLLWRKNKLAISSSKFRKGKLERSTKTRKLLTGRNAFKKLKNLSAGDSKRLWRRLPLESRRYWQGEGQGKVREGQREHSLVLKQGEQARTLDFLSKMIN